MKLIGNGMLITRNADTPFIKNGCVAVSGSVIEDFGKTDEMRGKYPEAEFFDANGQVIMPGLINAHMHIYSAFARGLNLKNAPVNKNFGQILENLWWRIDKVLDLEDVKYSAYTTYIDCIKNGVTTVFDHHASQFHVKDSLFTIGETAKELGIRTSLCYEVSDRDGKDVCEAAIKENAEFIKHANGLDGDMQKGMFGLHASFTVSDDTLEKCAEAMGSMNAGFHVHTAEGIDDLYDALKKYGKRVVQRLYDAKVLGPKTIAVHCIHVNGAEMELLKDTGTIVVHNPESNMGNAVGCSPAIAMLERGITVGMGTDGYTSDMLESYKVANIIHKHHLCDPSVAWGEAPQMLFANNKNIAERFFKKPIGIIEKGAYADVIVVDYDPLTPMDETNMNGHILFGMNGRCVTSTMINGEFVMKDRTLVNADEKMIFAKSREVAQKFWNNVNK